MNLTLVISEMNAGGAQRVVSLLAGHWCGRGWRITLLTLDDGSRPSFYELDPRIRREALGLAVESRSLREAAVNNLRSLAVLRRAIRRSRPDAVIGFIDRVNALTIWAARGLGAPVVVSERTDPAQHSPGRAWEILRRLSYPFASRIAVQTERAKSYFPPNLRRRIAVIPNPVAEADGCEEIGISSPCVVLGMGRLGPEKGFDLLLRAFAQVRGHRPEWRLRIFGEGPERAALERLRDDLGLAGAAEFPGITKQPGLEFRRAGIFALSSRFEGFPNVLLEAMAHGMAVASFDCRSGPAEIIRSGEDGILVPANDVSAMAHALDSLMADDAKRRRLGQRATEAVKRYAIAEVAAMWDPLLRFDQQDSGFPVSSFPQLLRQNSMERDR